MDNGWNMISVPVVALDFRKDELFPASVSSAFAYEGSYIEKDTLANRTGYWLKFNSAGSDSLTGLMLLNDSMNVSKGWNMIGSISRPVAVTSITSDPAAMNTSSFWRYDHGYHSADTIYPGKGYWVKVDQNGMLILSSSSALSSANYICIVPTAELPPPPPTESMAVINPKIPVHYHLDQNYPNPFNPSTIINYQLPPAGGGQNWVTLKVFDVLGREIKTLVNGVEEPGYKSVTWDASHVPSGVYFYRLSASPTATPAPPSAERGERNLIPHERDGQAGIYMETKKLLLLK